MAVAKRRRRGSWLMFTIRALGIVGFFALLLGALVARSTSGFSFRQTLVRLGILPESFLRDSNQIVARQPLSFQELLFETPDQYLRIAYWLIILGAVAVIVSIVFQL